MQLSSFRCYEVVVVFGGGDFGRKYCSELRGDIEIVAIVDNNWQNIQGWGGYSFVSPSILPTLTFDYVMICLSDYLDNQHKIDIDNIIRQLLDYGIPYRKIRLYTYMHYVNAPQRVGWLKQFAEIINERQLDGAVAECGVFRGHFASEINRCFPNRKLYLFDTFEGFCNKDLIFESQDFIDGVNEKCQHTKFGSAEITLMRCPHPERVVIKQGWIPETFKGLEDERFAFVNLDVDVYAPTIAALRYFAPRMVNGGIILCHDYYMDHNWVLTPGVKKAIFEFMNEYDFSIFPIGDYCSIGLTIIKEV